ncbi:protein serine/threonine phosphatase 2C family protein [Phanerochaete sordida]|uniref:Protein serine/threonine phosphatase 2C family protein n=1 Tax=Phanerochaete sordida TaxID=48140 RepID=A0A9P3G095_9APHY|nr:protein serine/threonine phosphatase 2C family protein [Phanerochaete sordida]
MAALRLCNSFSPRLRAGSRIPAIAQYHDYVRFHTPGGTGRIPLNNPKIIGVANSRGNRGYQEDFYSFAALSLDPEELRVSLKKYHGLDWDPKTLPEPLARQVLFVGIYDGHGGSTVSQYLRQELHGFFESADKSHVPDMLEWAKELGGYFKRYRGGVLGPWVRPNSADAQRKLDLEARATLAFFEIDRQLAIEKAAKECGATASVVLLQTLDNPVLPFFTAEKLALTVAHVGDTRVLLTHVDKGKVEPMTENHHPDTRIEAHRLRRTMGSGLILDSFGEARWMGALASTRALGDLKFKPYGVTPEPEVRSRLLHGPSYSHITLVSDGVSSVVSDDEISDLARGARTPREAADQIVSFASDMASQDNLTAIVVPLAGWGKVTGPDRTKAFREDRRTAMIGAERMQRM